MILIRIELFDTKMNDFFFIKCIFRFSFLHHLENYGPWILYAEYTKRPKEKNEFFNGFV